MAAVLVAFASKLAGILAGMARDEVEMLLGVPGEIRKLETTLGDLSSILGDAERRRIRHPTVERWVRELKDVMYDADNILDLCQIMEGGEDPRGAAAASGCWKIPMMSCFRNPVAAHEVGKKIQALNHRLVDIEQRSSRFGFISQLASSSNSPSSYYDGGSRLDSTRKTSPAIIQSDVVGEKIEQDTTKLVDLLVKDAYPGPGPGLVVIAITGAGGIGKTTLARMVFNHSMVVDNFDKKVWLSVNKEVSEISILQSVVSAVGGTYNALAADKALLEDALKLAVRQHKLLLIMDDVWSEEVWNQLLRAPLDVAAPGSRVLVTTRNRGVASGMKVHHVHQVDKLASEDSWSLLKKQVVNEADESEVDLLKDVGLQIVKKCDGLPLAVKVVGGLLLKKRKTRGAWMDVLNNIAWSFTVTSDDLNKSIYISYEELQPELKQCLLYCSLLPKGEVTNCGVVFRMWMAQGFLQDKTGLKLTEDLGLEYYRELISRNLLEPGNGYYDHSGCTMHDVVRSFAQYVAKNEGLLLGEGQDVSTSLANLKLRHLSISREAIELGALRAQVLLRTLMLFKCTQVTLKDLNYLCCLRVLLICDVNLVELPESVCHLKHLRYLGLQGTSISTIPQGIGDVKFLQVIDFEGSRNLCQLPESILKLQNLRFIRIDGTKITSVPRGFGKLESLVEVFGFPTHSDDSRDGWCSLEELGPLSGLTLLTVKGLEKTPFGSVAAKAELGTKLRLVWLNLAFISRLADNGEVLQDHISMEEKRRMEGVLANLCPPPSIQGLTISGYIGHQLPQWMTTMSDFANLRLLELSDYACCQQLPNGLGQLHFLDCLLIKRAPSIQTIGHDFLLPSLGGDCVSTDKAPVATDAMGIRQQCHHISPGAGVSFRKLATLSFEGMLGWTEWQWEEQVPAMPALEKLWIANCKLSHLPNGLAYHARALRVLDLRNVSRLICIEGFLSIVELWLFDNPKLERVANNPMTQQIHITRCPRVKVLEDLPSLRSIEWKDLDAEALPDYFRGAKLNKLRVDCSLSLLKLISLQDTTSEWGKIQHVQQLKAIGLLSQEDKVDRYVYYTKEPYYFDANMGESTDSADERVIDAPTLHEEQRTLAENITVISKKPSPS